MVLGIHRADGNYLGAPKGASEILPEDTLIVYGRLSSIEELDEKRTGICGDREHEEAMVEQEEMTKEEECMEKRTEREFEN